MSVKRALQRVIKERAGATKRVMSGKNSSIIALIRVQLDNALEEIAAAEGITSSEEWDTYQSKHKDAIEKAATSIFQTHLTCRIPGPSPTDQRRWETPQQTHQLFFCV